MNATKRLKKLSKRRREYNEECIQYMEFFLYAMALELHGEKDPYGVMRLERVTVGIIERVMQLLEFYAPEFALDGMKEQCRRFGYEVRFK